MSRLLQKHGVFFLEGSDAGKNWVNYEMNVDYSMDVQEFLDGAPFSITRSRRQKWSRKFDEMQMHAWSDEGEDENEDED